MDAGVKEAREQQQRELNHDRELKRRSTAMQKGFTASFKCENIADPFCMREVADDMYRKREHDVAAYRLVVRSCMSGHLPQRFDVNLSCYESVLSSYAFCPGLSAQQQQTCVITLDRIL